MVRDHEIAGRSPPRIPLKASVDILKNCKFEIDHLLRHIINYS